MSSSMKRCIACSTITVVVLLVLSLEAAVDAVRLIPAAADSGDFDAAIHLPSDGKGDHQATTVSSSAADDDKKQQLRWCEHPVCVPATDYCFCPYDKKQQQLWWCEHPVCVPATDYCFCPYTHDVVRTTMEKSGGAKNNLALHDSGAAPPPPCEHPFCIVIRGEPVCRCLDHPAASKSN